MICRRDLLTRDGRLVLEEAGEGPRTLLCIHGWTRSPRVWQPVLAETPPGWHSVAIDLAVRSDPLRGGYTLAALAERVHAALEALGVSRAVIAGHSMGGAVALDYTLGHPVSVARLVLVATGPRVPPAGQGTTPVALLRARGKTREVMEEILHNWFYRQPSVQEFAPMLEDAMLWPEAALFDLRASLEAIDYSARLREIAVPTLVIHGERDHTRPAEQATAMAHALPDGRLVVIEGVGHTPMHEAPAEFNRHFWPFVTAAGSPLERPNQPDGVPARGAGP